VLPTNVVLLHGGKGIVKRLEVGDAIVRVGRGALGVHLDAGDASSRGLSNDFRGEGSVKLRRVSCCRLMGEGEETNEEGHEELDIGGQGLELGLVLDDLQTSISWLPCALQGHVRGSLYPFNSSNGRHLSLCIRTQVLCDERPVTPTRLGILAHVY
jgi:hypothetical protein